MPRTKRPLNGDAAAGATGNGNGSGSTTGNGTGTVPVPDQPSWKVRQAKLAAQYVAAGGQAFLASYLRTLPPYVDDLTRDFGDDLYDRMHLDPQVRKCMRNLRLQILADDLTLRPAVAKDDPVRPQDHEESVNWMRFCERALERMERPIEDLGFEMLLCSMFGNKQAEIVYTEKVKTTAADAALLNRGDMWVWDKIKPKSRRSVRFVVDSYADVVGMLGLVPGQGTPVIDVTIAVSNQEAMKHVLPMAKFFSLTWMQEDESPLGNSLGRCIYNPWWWKLQMWAQYGKYLTQFATPSLIGTTAENAQAMLPQDADGNVIGQPDDPKFDPENVMLNRLLQFQGGTAMVVPFGASVDPLVVQGNGQAFLSAFELFDRQISEGLTGQSLATNQPKAGDGNRSTAEVHQDVMGLLPVYGKRLFANAVRRQLLYRLIFVNAGRDAAERFTPYASLAAAEQQDRGALLVSVAGAYKDGFIAASQLEAVDEWVGLPPRQAEEVKLAQKTAETAANPQPVPAPGKGSQGKSGQPGKTAATADGNAGAVSEPTGAGFADEEGVWRTIHGTPVLINGGVIEKGPAHLVGKKPEEVGHSAESGGSGGGGGKDWVQSLTDKNLVFHAQNMQLSGERPAGESWHHPDRLRVEHIMAKEIKEGFNSGGSSRLAFSAKTGDTEIWGGNRPEGNVGLDKKGGVFINDGGGSDKKIPAGASDDQVRYIVLKALGYPVPKELKVKAKAAGFAAADDTPPSIPTAPTAGSPSILILGAAYAPDGTPYGGRTVASAATAVFHAGQHDFAALADRMAREYPTAFCGDDGGPLDDVGRMQRLLGFVQAADTPAV